MPSVSQLTRVTATSLSLHFDFPFLFPYALTSNLLDKEGKYLEHLALSELHAVNPASCAPKASATLSVLSPTLSQGFY